MEQSAPGVAEVLRHWSWDVPWLVALVAAGAWYVFAAIRLNRPEPRVRHPWWKTVVFVAGLGLVGIATQSPLEHYGNQALWINFTGFLVLTMVAAPLIVVASPLTLAFRSSGKDGRLRLRRLYRSRPATAVAFPIVAWLVFAVVTYVWQFSVLAERAAANAFLRDLQQVTLLLVALNFWTPALCADPVRWRMAYPLRALYVFLEMTHKGLFGAMFLSMSAPFHSRLAAKAPAWAPDALTDQRLAIAILWIGGNVIFIGALIGIIARWVRYDARATARTDRRLEIQRAAARQRRAALQKVFEK
jgi:putative copper resistance protein D